MAEQKLCKNLNSRIYKSEESVEAEGGGSASNVVAILQPSKDGLNRSPEALTLCGT